MAKSKTQKPPHSSHYKSHIALPTITPFVKAQDCRGGVLEWEMAGIVSEEAGVGRSTEGISSGQRYQSGEALAEWRSSEQLAQ
ncbi:hypothetical protein NC651_035926 [Populus alba x Populus x berolinensis]|nr:hypothetical protein NC651_035926 [Populus alba x Populus x berolinensis]